MQWKLKIISLSICMLIVTNQALANAPKQIANYKTLVNVLTAGHEVKAIMDLGKCSTSTPQFKVNGGLTGGVNIEYFIKVPLQGQNSTMKSAVITSSAHLIHDFDYGVVQMYTELLTQDDGSVTISGELINPVTNTIVAKGSYNCHLSGSDKDNNGVAFYDLNH